LFEIQMGTLRIISTSSEPFSGRVEAGESLARELKGFRRPSALVLGIPRGGIIIARRVASALETDLDIILSHKLGAPGNPELAIGAVCEDGTLFVNETIAIYAGADESYIHLEKTRQLEAMSHRISQCRQVLPKLPLDGKVVIVTDDGVATGATMRAALWAVRQEKAKKIIAALPVGPEDTLKKLAEDADETICLKTPPYFEALGRFYLNFSQVEDEEFLEILEQESKRRSRE
jgi:putative phosphoribosyl transferase